MSRLTLPALIILLYSCSPASKISRQAQSLIIQDSALKNAHVGILIFDPSSHKELYSYQADKFFVPASNTKIPTCYVALKYLPDSLVSYYYESKADTIFIQPSGDPTFLHPDYPFQPSFEFLKNYSYVKVEDAYFKNFLGSGWSWNDYEEYYMAQRSLLPMYGNVSRFIWKKDSGLQVLPAKFKETIQAEDPLNQGIWVRRSWDENVFSIWPGTAKSATLPFRPDMATILKLLQDTLHKPVTSFPLQNRMGSAKLSQLKDSMLKPMMHRSDNFFAEQSLVMAAKQVMNQTSINSIIDSVLKTDFSGLPQKPRWVDGSGLSRYNLFTPASLVAILNKIENQFGMQRVKLIFAAGGEGTLNNYYKDYSQRFFAKTGTLSGVVALSGYMYTNKNRLLIFSVLVNNHQSSATAVRRAVEKFLVGIMEKE
jgi:serine-type D-Ala-D-Ala carboxypeptidase/endopeptidase (penicillin-binding protein 4)